MDTNQNLTQNVDTLFSNLENFTQNEGLIGKAVTHGDKTLIPVVSVTLGYGSGNSAGKNQAGNTSTTMGTGSSNMTGGALGLGAKLTTDAVIVIDSSNNNNVSVLPLSSAGATSQIMDKIPQILSGMGQNNQQGQQQNQSQNQSQNQQNQQY